MRAYSLTQSGPVWLEQRSGGSTTTSLSFRTARTVSLTAVGSVVHGNYHDPNPQSFERLQDQRLKGRYGFTYNGTSNGSLYIGNMGYSSDPASADMSFSSNLYNTVLSDVYDSIRGDLDVSVDLFEGHQTRDMLGRAQHGLNTFVDVVRQMRRSPTRLAANLWLEWTYGWKPLASSIYGTMNLFRVGPKNGFIRIKKRRTERGYRDLSWSGIGDPNLPTRTFETSSKRCEICAEYWIHDSVVQNLASMTSLNPVSIAWELMPYSFVLDWFVDVGGYLRNLESAFLYRTMFKRGYVTESILVTGNSFVNRSYNDGTKLNFAMMEGAYRHTKKRRTLFNGVPRLPSFHFDLGWRRLLSMVSIARQNVGR